MSEQRGDPGDGLGRVLVGFFADIIAGVIVSLTVGIWPWGVLFGWLFGCLVAVALPVRS